MGKFNRGGGFGGGNRFDGHRGGFGGGNRFGGNRDRQVEMHDAVCDECHKKCQVPFRPSGDKPIYCSECFGNKREGGSSKPNFDRAPRRDFSPRPQESNFSAPVKSNDETKKQLDAITIKLDSLIRSIDLLVKSNAPKSAPVTVKPIEVVKAKVEVKAKSAAPKAKKVVKKAGKK